MDSGCRFTVPGRPQRWMRPSDRIDRKGRRIKVTDKKAVASKKTIATYANIHWFGRTATGPVVLEVKAIFAIPDSWPDKLKAAARECEVPHIADPDLDQLIKQVMDALKGIVYVDDNQVVGFGNSCKRYGTPERTEIAIMVLPQLDHQKTPGQRRLENRSKTGTLL